MERQKIVEYSGTKNHYKVIMDSALMKDPGTRKWVECVIYEEHRKLNDKGEYVDVPRSDKQVFVREKHDFLTKFTLCLDL